MESVDISKCQASIALADALTRELRAILHGNGLGKFSGAPDSLGWFSSLSPTATKPHGSSVQRSSEPDPGPKRQKTVDSEDSSRLMLLGVLNFDSTAAGSNRLPTTNIYRKRKGARTPGCLCTHIPCRVDGSTIWGDLREPESAVVIHSIDYEWSLTSIATVLAVTVGSRRTMTLSHGSALVWDASGILSFVVLDDELLLSLFNALPVSLL